MLFAHVSNVLQIVNSSQNSSPRGSVHHQRVPSEKFLLLNGFVELVDQHLALLVGLDESDAVCAESEPVGCFPDRVVTLECESIVLWVN